MTERLKTGIIEGAVENPRLHALVRYWGSKRDGLSIPSRGQIDPVEIPRLLPIVLIADATEAGAQIRLLGTDATAAYGQETQGKWVHEFNLGEFTTYWLAAFAQVMEAGAPASARGRFRNGAQLCSIETVLMPLSNDGLSVTHIFGGLAITPLPPSATVEREFSKPPMRLADIITFPKTLLRR